MFYDEAKIYVEAGAGGNGAMSFRREKYVPRGGPDGGNGGKGGDVYLVVDPQMNTLLAFRRRRHFRAERGGHGKGKKQYGKQGADLEIAVAPGTIVRDAESGELLADLTQPGQPALVARGGRRGRGNAAFASPSYQAPRLAEKGEPGQVRWLQLELKLLADVGIVGVPNAGKSTLLAAVTAAKPKIADYPFTTLEPNLGMVELDDGRSFVLVDIPGLIEGAHAGAGLGDQFLRHIERTRLLIHLLDGLSNDPLREFESIHRELALFNPTLAEKPRLVALNKIDLPPARAQIDPVREQLRGKGIDLYPISAVSGEGVRVLLYKAADLLDQIPKETPREPVALAHREAREDGSFRIQREPGGYRIRGARAERLVAMTDFRYSESILKLHQELKALGVVKALEEAGIKPGDTVYVGELELEWGERL
ncbi:MAG: GTPase ObgE [Chloroflexi bacterium]|nr:GTPase ObgE [Chloroflexota bacterium]